MGFLIRSSGFLSYPEKVKGGLWVQFLVYGAKVIFQTASEF